jgi:hypothetical protein
MNFSSGPQIYCESSVYNIYVYMYFKIIKEVAKAKL